MALALYVLLQRSSVFTVLTSMSTNPFRREAFKCLVQEDMSLFLARSFLTVKEGPSRVFKPHQEVTSLFYLKLTGSIYCVLGLFTAQSHQMLFFSFFFFLFFGELFLPSHIRFECSVWSTHLS